MGWLNLPEGARVYVDTQILIYSIERHTTYWPMLRVLWEELEEGRIAVVSSQLAVLETLVGAFKSENEELVAAYKTVLLSDTFDLVPISLEILEKAARLRATTRLKAPDAIHAATALSEGSDLFLTNDKAFKNITELHPVVLNDVIEAAGR